MSYTPGQAVEVKIGFEWIPAHYGRHTERHGHTCFYAHNCKRVGGYFDADEIRELLPGEPALTTPTQPDEQRQRLLNHMEEASKIVRTWPAWKQDLLGGTAACIDTPANDKPDHDTVSSPPHYTQGGIECIDAIRAALTPEEFRGFLKGNVLKYNWRERHKGGVESLRKAAWYLDRLINNTDTTP